MSKILTLSFVSAKLASLACFSVMGMMGNMNMAQAVPTPDPCHQTEVAEENTLESNCSACMEAEELWSHDFVSANNIVLQDFSPAVLPMVWEIQELKLIEIVERETLPDPPEIAFWASPLRTQEGIVLLN